jgi:hypothetical protein
MLRRTIAFVLLVSTANPLFAGCTRTVTVSLYESGELRHNAITGVTLKAGEQETFTERGGQFNAGRRVVTGVTADHDSVVYRLSDLSYIETIARISGLAMTCDVPSNAFPTYYKNPKPGKIVSVTTRGGLRNVFDRRGGSIDIAVGAITGYSQLKTPVSVALEDVAQVSVKKQDKIGSALLAVGIIGAFITIELAIAIHEMDFFGDASND